MRDVFYAIAGLILASIWWVFVVTIHQDPFDRMSLSELRVEISRVSECQLTQLESFEDRAHCEITAGFKQSQYINQNMKAPWFVKTAEGVVNAHTLCLDHMSKQAVELCRGIKP